jgi:hypothetical protein
VAVTNGYAYLAAFDAGLEVLDLGNPTQPVRLATYHPGGLVMGIALAGKRAYLANDWAGVQVLDLSDPLRPVKLRCFDTGSRAYSVAASSEHVFVANGESGLLVVQFIDLPHFTSRFFLNGRLNLSWSPENGVLLQRATSLTNPDWQQLLGSDQTNNATLPVWSGNEFFRLVEP